ncbi:MULTISPECIES: hypothetical protein [unclassified Sphingobacterium]|uniref:hypothetical protein n=1 Tax=unclassified Sphingobacterium TaxID=2609468 RepID=UPI00143B9C04|nr:hypothetical protein [Sphingobacterium sp. B16(2022)]NJI72884.1 hypothetical protein [Sphingobacterium sp. B16(2022)]
MKPIMLLMTVYVLFSCSHSAKIEATYIAKDHNCDCEKTVGIDRVLFATNIRLKNEKNRRVLLFNCATVHTGIASISDADGKNEREKFIYDLDCISAIEQSQELSDDFKYYTESMQSSEDFFQSLNEEKKFFYELTFEKQKIKSILKVELD